MGMGLGREMRTLEEVHCFVVVRGLRGGRLAG